MAKRAMFLWVVAGLFLTASVVAAQTLVDADEVVAAAGAEGEAPPAEVRAAAELEVANGVPKPKCEYPDNCPPPPPKCEITVEMGEWELTDQLISVEIGGWVWSGQTGQLQIGYTASHAGCPLDAEFSEERSSVAVRAPISNPFTSAVAYTCNQGYQPAEQLIFRVSGPAISPALASVSVPIPDPRYLCPTPPTPPDTPTGPFVVECGAITVSVDDTVQPLPVEGSRFFSTDRSYPFIDDGTGCAVPDGYELYAEANFLLIANGEIIGGKSFVLKQGIVQLSLEELQALSGVVFEWRGTVGTDRNNSPRAVTTITFRYSPVTFVAS